MMAWRVIGINNPAQLSVKDYKLVIKQEESVSIPIEDIDSLILDSYGIITTVNLLVELTSRDTTVVMCDEKHMPSSVLLPYSQHSRQAKVSRQQIAMKLPFKKQLWQKIVTQKIFNQAAVLAKHNFDASVIERLAQSVRSGDLTNRESQAARHYFSLLLDDATRRKPLWHNSALNYGYAMVRSHIARHVAARGLVASIGIFHRSELNSFNIVDDLIEPFRPAVDDYILTSVAPFHVGEPDTTLSKEERQSIVDILNNHVTIESKRYTIRHAAELVVESFVQSIASGKVDNLVLPKIIS
jgi:CRISP-associated protein Cas1